MFPFETENTKEDAMNDLKAFGYPFGAAVVASLAVLLLGGLVLGFNFAVWTETGGRITGIFATIAGIVGAYVGLKIALKASQTESVASKWRD
jgi:hypothetical protein